MVRYLEKLVVHAFPDSHGQKKNSSYLADGKYGDLNKGMKGHWTYIQPVWTTHRKDAASYVHVHIGGKQSGKGQDYAKGCRCSHEYRYITVSKKSNKKIEQVKLVEKQIPGWQHTRDLNEGRGGRYLYIAYRFAPDEVKKVQDLKMSLKLLFANTGGKQKGEYKKEVTVNRGFKAGFEISTEFEVTTEASISGPIKVFTGSLSAKMRAAVSAGANFSYEKHTKFTETFTVNLSHPMYIYQMAVTGKWGNEAFSGTGGFFITDEVIAEQ